MRTETRTYTLYQITELSGEAKEKAYDEWLYSRYYYASHYSYDYRSRQDDSIDGLCGWRLATYLTNNHWSDLYTPKFYWNGRKGRKSRILVDTCCPLTGYYIDDCILDPIYKFLESPTETVTFDNLMNDCLDSFFRACRDDMESTQTLEYFTEESNANGWEYLSDGKLFN